MARAAFSVSLILAGTALVNAGSSCPIPLYASNKSSNSLDAGKYQPSPNAVHKAAASLGPAFTNRAVFAGPSTADRAPCGMIDASYGLPPQRSSEIAFPDSGSDGSTQNIIPSPSSVTCPTFNAFSSEASLSD